MAFLPAQVAKLVDAPASGAGDRKVVGVRVPSSAHCLRNSSVDRGHFIKLSLEWSYYL